MRSHTKNRMTRQRKAILEELRKVNTHPAADEIYEMVKKRLPRISLGTVYRNLERLVSLNLIRKLDAGSGPNRYDGRVENHYHVRCVRCGRVEDINVECRPEIERIAKENSDYEIVGHVLEFTGLCPMCREGEFESRPLDNSSQETPDQGKR